MDVFEIQGGFGIGNLRRAQRPDPTPGPGQVRVRVRAASLNYRDLLMVRGEYNPRQPLPLVPCSDGAGEIDAVGEGVRGIEVGQRVAGMFAPKWQSGDPTTDVLRATLGGPIDGMLGQAIVLDQSGVVRVPDHLSDVEAATLPCAALTAWSALVTYGGIRSGDTVLVIGTGGVSSFALDFASMHGARVIATSRSATKLAAARERGAWETIDTSADPKWGKRARELTGGRGVDHVVEVGGAGTLGQSLRAVRAGGTVSLIGVLAGGAADLNLTPVLMNNIRVQGIFVGHRAGFEAMNRAIAHHELRPVVDKVFPFAEAPAAFEYLERGEHRGKICIAM